VFLAPMGGQKKAPSLWFTPRDGKSAIVKLLTHTLERVHPLVPPLKGQLLEVFNGTTWRFATL
jgi:hypothetical protein